MDEEMMRKKKEKRLRRRRRRRHRRRDYSIRDDDFLRHFIFYHPVFRIVGIAICFHFNIDLFSGMVVWLLID
jgi:hypothetical protein